MKKLKKYARGFTLLETVVYIALLGFILTGAVASSYKLVSNSSKIDASNNITEEGSFFIKKLSWTLSGANTIAAPNGWGNALMVTRYDGIVVEIRQNAGAIEMRENSAVYTSLTSADARVSSVSFHFISAVNNSPAGLEASTTINGQTFYFTYYLRL